MNFIQFARAHGIDIDNSKFFQSDRIKRCGTVDKPNSGNGAYFWDGQRGWVMDWSGEAKVIWFEDPNATPWTDQEKRDWANKRKEQTALQTDAYNRVARQAEVVLRAATLETHPYLSYKGFEDEKGLVSGDKLLIPMRNVTDNALQGYQQIYYEKNERQYEKKMLSGMRAKNAVFRLGAKSKESWLVEGYATGLSVYKALRSCGQSSSVIVCFSASNMINVADQVSGRVMIFADNDVSGVGQNAAISTGKPWTMPDVVGMDANDLHMKDGLFSVVSKIMGVLTTPIAAV